MFYSTKNILFTLSCLWLLTSCTDEATVNDTVVGDKTPIALSVGGADTVSILKRAITQDPAVANRGQLPAGTALFMVMKSEKAEAKPLYTVTKGTTEAPDDEMVNRVSFGEGYMRYWDDCYARDAQVSIYAACSPGSTETITIGGRSDYQYTDLPTTGAWSTTVNDLTIANVAVSTNQTATTLRDEDLCYSNNLADNAPTYRDGRLKFNTQTKKFDHGRLAFYHALSKITFVVKRGKGFDESEFLFNSGTNIRLTDFYTKNTLFNIATGEFTGAYSGEVIQTMAQSGNAATGYTLEALVMPTTDLSTAVKGDIDFTIAHNHYQLSKADLLEKINEKDKTDYLAADGTRLKPGVNYIFTLTIGKTGVDNITATVVEWETVNAEELKPSNAKVTLTLEDRRGTVKDADIYRLAETAENITGDITTEKGKGYVWSGTYEERNRLMGSLQTDWFWPNNKTFYHFRAITPTGTAKKTDAGKDYVALEHGETIDDDHKYTDVTWGAPFKDIADTEKIAYTTTHGFDGSDAHQIYHAIGATNDAIKLLLFHAMSDISFDIYTTDASDPAKMDLGDGTKDNRTTLRFENLATTGKVWLGNGLVTEDATKVTYPFTTYPAPDGDGHLKWNNYGAVPQDLTNVVLVITTPDHNEYRVAMKDVVAKSAISSTNVRYPAYTDNKVNRWYPGVKYTYTFKLTKKGITDLKATILEWETITAGKDDVQIQ